MVTFDRYLSKRSDGSGDGVIAKLSVARQALIEAKTIGETKKVMDVAHAAEIYAKRQKLGEEAIGHAHEIKVYALRKLGEMLRENPPDKRIALKKGSVVPKRDYGTLSDLGIDKKVSSLAQQIAALPESKIEAVAKRVESIAEVMRGKKATEIRKKISLPDAKYHVIYADPPWSYNDKCDDGSIQSGGAEKHYPSMSIDELCDMPISKMCEESAVLFLWVTSPLLEECFSVIKAWGFKYKASFVWDKVKHNMGHYNSVRHEFLLICTKGSCPTEEKKLFDSVVSSERTKHSEKPEIFRKMIDALYPSGKRIELFARKEASGWDAYGNQV